MTSEPATIEFLPAHLSADMADSIAEVSVPSIRTAYWSSGASFSAWANSEGLTAMPATTATVTAYMTANITGGKSISTARLHRASILRAHHLVGTERFEAADPSYRACAGWPRCRTTRARGGSNRHRPTRRGWVTCCHGRNPLRSRPYPLSGPCRGPAQAQLKTHTQRKVQHPPIPLDATLIVSPQRHHPGVVLKAAVGNTTEVLKGVDVALDETGGVCPPNELYEQGP